MPDDTPTDGDADVPEARSAFHALAREVVAEDREGLDALDERRTPALRSPAHPTAAREGCSIAS